MQRRRRRGAFLVVFLREAISRRLVDLSHFMRDEDEYVSFGLELPKYDADRHIRLMFRRN